MRTSITAAAIVGLGFFGLSACGSDDSPSVEQVESSPEAESDADAEPSADEEASSDAESSPDASDEPSEEAAEGGDDYAELLLSAEEFPLEGFTRGEVTGFDAEAADQAAEDAGVGDADLESLFGGQDLSPECSDALDAANVEGGDQVGQQSLVDFTKGDETELIPQTVGLAIGNAQGDSPLEALSAVSEACETVTMEEEGMSIEMSFSPLTDLEGTLMSVGLQGFNVEFIVAGEMVDEQVVAVTAIGVDEADVATVIEAQVAKLESAG